MQLIWNCRYSVPMLLLSHFIIYVTQFSHTSRSRKQPTSQSAVTMQSTAISWVPVVGGNRKVTKLWLFVFIIRLLETPKCNLKSVQGKLMYRSHTYIHTYLFTSLLTYLLPYSLIYLLTHLFYLFIYLLPYSLIYLLTHLLTVQLAMWCCCNWPCS
jgi:hypothetical protein